MSDELVARLAHIPGAATMERRTDGLWMFAPQLDVTAMAHIMNDLGCRLSTMSGIALDDGETMIIYHYTRGQATINLKTQTRQHALPSIATLTRPANWIEREIHDLFAVDFSGHPNLARLVRPPQLEEGFYREPGGAASKNVKG